MKILSIAPRLPFPADTGGKIRTLNILKQLAGFAEIDLLCFSFEREDEGMSRLLRKQLRVNVHMVSHREPDLQQKIRLAFFEQRPFSVAKYFSHAMKTKIRTLTAQCVYDAVHFDHIHMAQYRNELKTMPAVVDDHNVEYRIMERCAEVEKNPFKKFLFQQQVEKMRDYEREAVSACTACAAVSADDAETLRILTSSTTRVHVVPNGVDTEYFKSAPAPQNPSDPDASAPDPQNPSAPGPRSSGAPVTGELATGGLVFTGSMDWLPNDDAMQYFIKEIFPLLKAKKADIMLYIVGKSPSPKLLEMAKGDPAIEITGRVDDVRSYIEKAAVFVVPLRIGGGTRLKILEAMSMAKPVVSTTLGAEGIAHTPDQDIVLADRPEDFAHQILDLLSQPQKARSIGHKGRELVLQKYDWKIIGHLLKDIYHEIIQRSF